MSELRLKRHETFCLREGWLEKGLNIGINNPIAFSKDNGPLILGLGSNMCKSLRYWMEACGLFTFSQKGAYVTSFGKFILNRDPFIEEKNTLWLIHLFLVTNKEDATVFNTFFNSNYNKCDKELLTERLMELYKNEYGIEPNKSSLEADISVLFKSYYAEEYLDPENNNNCIFSKLGLLKMNDRKMYVKSSAIYRELDYRVVYYSILKCFNQFEGELSFNIEDLCERDNNPLKVFNISKSALFSYLEEMRKNNLIVLIKTAGLNLVRIEHIKNIEELF